MYCYFTDLFRRFGVFIRTLSPENRRINRSSHNIQGNKDVNDCEQNLFGMRNNSSNSAIRPTHRAVGHHSDERVFKRKNNLENVSSVDSDLVDSILNVSILL